MRRIVTGADSNRIVGLRGVKSSILVLLPRCRLRGILHAANNAFYQHLDRYTLADCLIATGAPARRPQRQTRQRRSRVAAS